MTVFPQHLLDGYRAFAQGRLSRDGDRYRELAAGQSPTTMVIGCCDSRAAPETIFESGPGEIFVVRNVANLVPPFAPDAGETGTAAGIEFAVNGLGVSNIVVMGHSGCGGIKAARDTAHTPLAEGDFIGKWMAEVSVLAKEMAAEGQAHVEDPQTLLERLSVRSSLANLRTFPYVAEREADGDLALHGAWFDIGAGALWRLDQDSGEFERL